MPIFGNKLDIIVGNSGSTSSLDAINFIYTNPNYGAGIQSSSVGTIVFSKLNPQNNGAAGTIEFRLASPETANTQGTSVLSIQATGSNNSPLVGIGLTSNQIPLGTLDIRSTTSSVPANLILRTNEDGLIEENEETGRIIFAIESSSISGSPDFLRSGSTAEIFSRVKNANSSGETYGNLIIQVNDANSRTQPLDILELGYGASDFSSTLPAAKLSGSLDLKAAAPYIYINQLNGTPIGYLGYNTPTGFNECVLRLYSDYTTGSVPQINLRPGGNSYISSSYNLGIGTRTPSAKLHVIGNIFASGSITGSAISASGNISLGNRIGKGTTYIDFNSGVANEIKIVNNNTASLFIKANGNISASSLLFASASEGPGSFTVLTYNTSSGQFFFTSSAAIGGAGSTPNLQQVTSQSPLTTAAITASVFTASIGIFGNLKGTPNSYITASTLSASNGIYGPLVGTGNSNITASMISASFISASRLTLDITGSNGGIMFGATGELNSISYDGTSLIFGITDIPILSLNSSSAIILSSLNVQGGITSSLGISASSAITASGYRLQNISVIESSSAGLIIGSNNNHTSITGQSIQLKSPTTASIISSSAYIKAASITASSANIIGNISASAGHFLGVHADGGGGPGTYLRTSGDAPGSSLKLEFGDLDNGGNGTKLVLNDASERIFITASAGIVLSPTSSGTPTISGSDGQVKFGSIGNNHYMFVWMAGAWRSSSLS